MRLFITNYPPQSILKYSVVNISGDPKKYFLNDIPYTYTYIQLFFFKYLSLILKIYNIFQKRFLRPLTPNKIGCVCPLKAR